MSRGAVVIGQISKEDYLRKQISDFVSKDSRNAMAAHGGMRIYDSPLIGVASAVDPLFERFKDPDIICPEFKTPQEWLKDAKSIISYFLPFTKEVRDSNRFMDGPSQEWMSARIDGEFFNDAVRIFIIGVLKDLSEVAIAPAIDPRFENINDLKSNWSERHIAFAAGLGTFGLHKALITAKGCAGRFGSVLTTLEMTPTTRNYTHHYEYCPYLMHGKCGACIKRCASKAITEDGKNKVICKTYIDTQIKAKYIQRWGCAKCNIKVPCESGIPKL